MVEWVQIRIPEELYKKVTTIITEKKFWINEHDFIRDAVREKLAQCVAPGDPLIKKEVETNG